MTMPTHLDLLNPTLRALEALGGSASLQELNQRVIQDLNLPDETTGQIHGNGPMSEVEYRLAWSRTYLKRFGLLDNPIRGVWSLVSTKPRGLEVDPAEVQRTVAQRTRRESLVTRVTLSKEQVLPEEEDNGETATWRERLIDALLNMSPSAFERLCQRLLRESGFIEVEVTGRSGDGGIDGHGIIRMGGLISFPVLFQCKRYSGSVTASTVRDFRGAMAGRSDKGLLITTGGFTRDARQEATRDGAPPIDLIDGNLLADKLKELKLGVSTEMVEQVTIDADWFSSI